MEAFALFFLICIVCSVWKEYKYNRGFLPGEEPVTHAPAATGETRAAENWARSRITLMEKKGLGEYIGKDYYFRHDIIRQDLRSLKTLEVRMNEMLTEMMEYLKLPKTFHVQVIDNQCRQVSANHSGNCDFAHYTINVFYQSHFTEDTLRTILCHECAHYFAYHYGLDDRTDSFVNERYTDILAMLMGFGKYLLRTKGNPGYLREQQLQAVRWMQVKKRRATETWRETEKAAAQQQENARKAAPAQGFRTAGQAQASAAQSAAGSTRTGASAAGPQPSGRPASFPEERDRLRRQIAAAREMISQAKDLVRVRQIPSRTDLYPQDYAFLEQAVNQLNNGKYEQLLRNSESRLSGNQRDLTEASGITLSVCEEISRTMRAFA